MVEFINIIGWVGFAFFILFVYFLFCISGLFFALPFLIIPGLGEYFIYLGANGWLSYFAAIFITIINFCIQLYIFEHWLGE